MQTSTQVTDGDNSTSPTRRFFPWVMLLLAVTLLAGQAFNRSTNTPPVLAYYTESGLQALEWDYYLAWVSFNGQSEHAQTLREQANNGNPHAYAHAIFSADFVADSKQRRDDLWSEKQFTQWQTLRAALVEKTAASPLYQFGLSPLHLRPARFFSAPFTGTLPSLIISALALLLLAPFATSLERKMGHAKTALLWLLGCVSAGVGYLLVAGSASVPFHGAAPVLLALLGALASTQQGSITCAPALPGKPPLLNVTLPSFTLWLLPAVVLAALAAFSAPLLATLSAGTLALLTGAAIARLTSPIQQQADSAPRNAPSLSLEQQQRLARGWDALEALDDTTAVSAFTFILDAIPDHFDALTGLFAAYQIQQNNDALERTAHALFAHPCQQKGQATQVIEYWKIYRQRRSAPLPADIGWALVALLTREKIYPQAEALAQQLPVEAPESQAPLAALRNALHEEGLTQRANAIPQAQ